MTPSESARENLQVIRSLMERATVYRAISAPMALIGGLLSFAGFGVAWYAQSTGAELGPAQFLALWLIIFVITAGANIYFLWRESRQAGSTFFSPGMGLALRSLSPAFVFAGTLTLLLPDAPLALAALWINSYGIALLATQNFAPRSLIFLGLAFFLTGLASVLLCRFCMYFEYDATAVGASALMAATFGLYHLIYAASLWATSERSGEAHV